MEYVLLFMPVVAAAWVGWDARRRMSGAWIGWAVGTLILMALVMPVYLACRPLQDGERREGGRPWNVLRNFALTWTVIMAAATVWVIAYAPSTMTSEPGIKAAATFAIVLMVGALWFIPMISALLIGFFLKKTSMVEVGPTGRLASQPDPSEQIAPVPH